MTGASGAGLSSDWAAQHARAIIPLSLLQYQDTAMAQTDRDPLIIAGVEYQSRLLVGTGKYKDLDETRHAVEASGAENITVAIRRTNIGQRKDEPTLLDVLPPNRYAYLPNTAGGEHAEVPILVDAAAGTASDAAVAMELGCDGVLMNTAIAGAKQPVLMASAMN